MLNIIGDVNALTKINNIIRNKKNRNSLCSRVNVITTNNYNLNDKSEELRKAKGYSNYEHIAFDLEMRRSSYWRLETGANFELKTLIVN